MNILCLFFIFFLGVSSFDPPDADCRRHSDCRPNGLCFNGLCRFLGDTSRFVAPQPSFDKPNIYCNSTDDCRPHGICIAGYCRLMNSNCFNGLCRGRSHSFSK